MNLATILTAIPVAALIVWALVKTVRSRGRCSGCRGCGGDGSCVNVCFYRTKRQEDSGQPGIDRGNALVLQSENNQISGKTVARR